MLRFFWLNVLAALALSFGGVASAQSLRSKRIDIAYITPN